MDHSEDRSPDGNLLVRWNIDHGRMSHEIWTPTILDLRRGRTLLRIRQDGVDGRPQWRPGGFTLGLRHYHHPDVWLSFTVDLEREGFRFDDKASTEPLASLSERVDEELRRQIDAGARATRRERRNRRMRVFAAVSTAVVSAAAALLMFY